MRSVHNNMSPLLIELLGIAQSLLTIARNNNLGYFTVGLGAYTYTSLGGFLFLLFGIIAVALSCTSALNNALSIRVGAFFAWMALFLMSISEISGRSMIVWAALCLVMIVLHLLQIFAWTFGRSKARNG